jgi:hypothetical protein
VQANVWDYYTSSNWFKGYRKGNVRFHSLLVFVNNNLRDLDNQLFYIMFIKDLCAFEVLPSYHLYAPYCISKLSRWKCTFCLE